MNYYLICFILSAFFTVVHLYKWQNRYGLHYSLMYIFATIANLGYWQIYEATELNQAIFANKIAYIGGCFSTLVLLLCIFSVCKINLDRRIVGALFIITCVVYGTCLTVGYSDIFYKDVSLELVDGRYVMVKEYAFFHTIFYIMLVAYVLISLIALIYSFIKKKDVSVKSVGLMFIVLMINFLSFFGGRALFDVELICGSYVITEIIILILTTRLVLYNIDDMVVLSLSKDKEMGIASFDFKYNFLGCNDIAKKYYPNLENLSVDKKIDKDNEALEEIVSWLEELNEKKTFEMVYEREDKFYKVTGNYLYDKAKRRGYSFVFTDFTEEKERGDELVRVATKAKSDVLAQMSHEIRTPINAILGMNEMILRTTVEKETKQYSKDVKRATISLLEIINEILDFSKLESGKMELVCVEYNLSNLIYDVKNMFSIRAEEKGLKFILTIDKALPVGLYGDDVKLRQILANLLSNAVKYTPKGEVELKIEGITCDDTLKLRFSVRDTGVGIKQEDRDKLFNEFERIQEQQNRGIEGTGLGMSITMQLLHMMNSELQVESVYGEGSEFSFEVEQPIVDRKTIKKYEDENSVAIQDLGYEKSFVAPMAKILVVDDNKMNLKVFANLLSDTQIYIQKAESGQACLQLVAQRKYDIIFLDHMMPDMDGVETLHRLKAMENSKCKDAPVIALTANAVSGMREFFLEEGFDDYISKPLNPDALEKLILERLPKEYIKYDIENYVEKIEGDKENLPDIEGIDWNSAFSHFKSKEMLMKTMEDFWRSMEYEHDKLKKYYQELELNYDSSETLCQKYRVQVHSMKGTANLIGAVFLGKYAERLEHAARDLDTEYIIKESAEFLSEWRIYKSRLDNIFDANDTKIDFDKESFVEYLGKLKNALENMDVDEMDVIMSAVNEFSFSDDIMKKDIDSLNAFVTDLDEEQGLKLIEALIKKL